MKTFALFIWAAAATVALTASLHSQSAAPAAPKTPLEALQQMKAANAALVEKQNATLLKLDEIGKDAQQLKIFGKRS